MGLPPTPIGGLHPVSTRIPRHRVGIDSLALLESGTRVESEVGVVIPDDVVPELKSPRLFLEYVVEQAEVA